MTSSALGAVTPSPEAKVILAFGVLSFFGGRFDIRFRYFCRGVTDSFHHQEITDTELRIIRVNTLGFLLFAP
jgi:hypothetical protein